MIGGRFKLASVASIAAAGLFMGGVSAQAADLGGNCCADLEERVAELEATTARKNNRKVSLTVYGQVNRAIVWHNDDASNVGEFTSRDNDGTSGSRFGFKGSAKINADVSAGFLIEIGIDNAELAVQNGRDDVSGPIDPRSSQGVLFRHTMVWIKSEAMGQLKLGRTNSATEGITEICLGCALTPNSSQEGNQVSEAAASVVQIDGARENGIHYVSPTFAGFVISASWFHDGEAGQRNSLVGGTSANQHDDGWDVALRYAGEFGAFRVAAGVGYRYTENSNSSTAPFAAEAEAVSGSATIMHTPTGLFLQGSAGQVENETAADEDFWYVSGGISNKFNSLGKTGLTIGYGRGDEGDGDNPVHYGVGLDQAIDAAAMNLYINWKHYDADQGGVNDEADVVTAGAIIRF